MEEKPTRPKKDLLVENVKSGFRTKAKKLLELFISWLFVIVL